VIGMRDEPAIADLGRRFLRWYGAEYPERAHMRIECAEPISDGWESDVYAISLAHEQDGATLSEDLVLRLYHGQSGRAKAEREFHGMRQLAAAGYPVPRVQRLALNDSPFGQPCMSMERIHGRSMGDAFAEATDDERGRLLEQFCRLFVDLHALDWRPFVPACAAPDPGEVIASWLAHMHATAQQLQVQAFDPVLSWLEARRATIVCARCSVLHGDFHPYNILLRADGSAAVIDWTGIGLSDYRFDLAWTVLLLSTFGRTELRDYVLGEYERLTGQTLEQLAFFDVAACLRRLADFHITLTQDAVHLGMRPEAATIMRSRLAHYRGVYALLQERTGVSLPEIERLLTS
jgi:aminoglycoside phosphotransferase (APT) family kinase protein